MLRILTMALGCWVVAVAGQAAAQVSLAPKPSPVLGTTIRGTSPTTFRITTSGIVTRLSGDAIRLSNSVITTPTVSFNCGLLNLGGLCALRALRVTLSPMPGSAAAISRFRVSNLSGATYRTGSAPAEAQVLVFELNALGLLSTASFVVGMDVVLDAGATPGAHGFPFTVMVELL
ncbi:MAG: hypothetical protein V4466_06625 [Pseudomonadota bacterium]